MTESQRAQFFAIRKSMDTFVEKIVDNPVEINDNQYVIRKWNPGAYVIGDVRVYNNVPYKCVQSHNSTGNDGWNPPATPALWMQYHGTSVESARPWLAPTGAHDMYKTGEYMVWTDGKTYMCKMDTVYSPTDYAQAWEAVE